MKKLPLVFFSILSGVVLMAFTSGGENGVMDASGGPAGYAGDPSGGNKTCGSGGGCHMGAAVSTLNGVITSNIPPAGYTAGSQYTVTATFVRAGHSKFGFQISPQTTTGTLLGTMAVTSTQTKLVGSNKYITHTSSGTSGSGSKTWSFRWTAPAGGQGPVTFYGVFNATNSNNASSGDSIFKSTLVVNENNTAVQNQTNNGTFFTIFPNPASEFMIVQYSLSEPATAAITLFDLSGQVIQSHDYEPASGELIKTVSLSGLPSGIYFVRLRTGNNESVEKLIRM